MSEYRLHWAMYPDDSSDDDDTPRGFPLFGPTESALGLGDRVVTYRGGEWRYARDPSLVLEIVPGLGRSTFYVWEWDDDAPDKLYQSGPRWVRGEADDPGIFELLSGEDAQCAECASTPVALDIDWPGNHDSECYYAMPEEDRDQEYPYGPEWEGDFCCGEWARNWSDAVHEATGRSGMASYALLDGGDTLCRYHLWAEYDLVVDHSSRGDTLVSVLDRYALGASVEALFWETQAHAARARHNEAEYELGVASSWRDDVITNLRRLDWSQADTARLVGVSQQRISQLERERESSRRETIRGLVARLRDEGIDPPEDWIELVD